MTFLLRKASRSRWLPPDGTPQSAATDFRLRPEDSDGLSVYEVANDDDRLLILAAFACRNMSTARIDLVEVDRTALEMFGPVVATLNAEGTPLPEANLLHRSLPWTQEQLDQLVAHLFEQGVMPREYAKPEVLSAVRRIELAAVEGSDEKAFVARIRDGKTK